MLSSAILLGPQRHVRTVRAAIETLVPAHRKGPIAAVTAGWEEREAEDQELREHVGRPFVNLGIWSRVERILEQDQELLAAMRQRHDTLRSVQELYRLRLQGLMDATHELFHRTGEEALLTPARNDALAMVRQLDEQHTVRVAQIHAEFETRIRPHERSAVLHHRRDLQRLLGDAACLLVAGGHIAVLLHRLRLFDVFGLYGDRPVIAWSAGAMALCQRIVLFHDEPPQGSAWAEVMEAGFGLVPGVVALPHARKRLHTHDALNVQVMARRFAPASCALLDEGSRIDWNGRRWSARPGSSRLGEDGSVVEVSA
ncbi:MAG TPA: Type 1 glutamine amidotransferase-like domain-containing protein [Planctomycetota bacterium]|nr:Type 1 glutamine amidotransferase-like domain-containing protein [Planctomycetota bacterium]